MHARWGMFAMALSHYETTAQHEKKKKKIEEGSLIDTTKGTRIWLFVSHHFRNNQTNRRGFSFQISKKNKKNKEDLSRCLRVGGGGDDIDAPQKYTYTPHKNNIFFRKQAFSTPFSHIPNETWKPTCTCCIRLTRLVKPPFHPRVFAVRIVPYRTKSYLCLCDCSSDLTDRFGY